MQDYRKLKVWEKAHQLVLNTYRASKDFPKDELYGITSQLRRAATSISANIVEGSGRKTRPDFARFLTISLGSTNEVEYFLLLAKDLQYLSEAQYNLLAEQVTEVRKMLLSLENRILTATNRSS